MLVSQGWGSMNTGKTFALSFSVAFGLSVLGAFWFDITGQDIAAAEARHQRRQSSAASHSSHASHSTHAASGHSNKSARHHARGSGKQTHVAAGKSSKKGKAVASAGKPKYAYPLDFFMMRAPECDHSPLDQELAMPSPVVSQMMSLRKRWCELGSFNPMRYQAAYSSVESPYNTSFCTQQKPGSLCRQRM